MCPYACFKYYTDSKGSIFFDLIVVDEIIRLIGWLDFFLLKWILFIIIFLAHYPDNKNSAVGIKQHWSRCFINDEKAIWFQNIMIHLQNFNNHPKLVLYLLNSKPVIRFVLINSKISIIHMENVK